MSVPRPTIYLIAGCNGAGKTTFAKEFLPSVRVIRFLNADEIARGLSPLRPEAVAFKAGRLLLSELRELIDRHETFALESTLSGRTYVNLFENAKRQGYSIELHFVWIPDVREAIRRVRQRGLEGGHGVPPNDIRRDGLPEVFSICSTITHRWRPNGSCGTTPHRRQSCWQNLRRRVLFSYDHSSPSMKKTLYKRTEADPGKQDVSGSSCRVSSPRRATRKKRAELRRRGLPMIIWKDGKVREIPA